MEDEVDLYSVAIHEAAHAVIGVVVNIDPLKASFDWDNDNCYVEFEPFDPLSETPERCRDFAIVNYAAFAAQLRHNPDLNPEIYKEAVMLDRLAIKLCVEAVSQDPNVRASLYKEWAIKSRDLVDEHWKAIERMASALYESKALAGSDIVRLVRSSGAITDKA